MKSKKDNSRRFAGLFALTAALVLAAGASQAAPGDVPEPASTMTEDSEFTIKVENGKAKVGDAATISVTVTAAEGFKMNQDYPSKIKDIDGGRAVAVDSDSVRGKVDGKKYVRYQIEATPKKRGTHKLSGEIRFSVCNEESCHIKKVPLDATITGT